MDYPKFIVSNQKEESISIQRVKHLLTCSCCLDFDTRFILKWPFYDNCSNVSVPVHSITRSNELKIEFQIEHSF